MSRKPQAHRLFFALLPQVDCGTLAINAVSWTAKEIVLLDSHIGLTHYQEIARWPLER